MPDLTTRQHGADPATATSAVAVQAEPLVVVSGSQNHYRGILRRLVEPRGLPVFIHTYVTADERRR